MASDAGRGTSDAGLVYVGSLNVSRPRTTRSVPAPSVVAARGGSARRARLIIDLGRILIQPYGFFRGIFHDLIIPRDSVACIFQSTDYPVMCDFRKGQGVVIEQLWPESAENLQIQFFPRNVPVNAVLECLASHGYDIDWTPRKARLLG